MIAYMKKSERPSIHLRGEVVRRTLSSTKITVTFDSLAARARCASMAEYGSILNRHTTSSMSSAPTVGSIAIGLAALAVFVALYIVSVR